MYSSKDKIIKDKDAKTSEIEEEVAKALVELENNSKDAGADLKKLKINAASYLGEGDKRILHIVVPYPLLALVRKNHSTLINNLETKFKVPVAITGKRTILSKYGILLVPLF